MGTQMAMTDSVKRVSYGNSGQGGDMLAQIFQELFFDSMDEHVDGLLVLDTTMDFLAGNERGKELCEFLFPVADTARMSCIQTAGIIKNYFQRGYSRFFVQSRNQRNRVFDFSLFPKTLGHDKSLNCYLCTIGEKNTDPRAEHGKEQVYEKLTRRQVEVVKLVAAGMSNREIAEQLSLSEHTVHKHLENIRERLGVNNRIGILKKVNQMYE